MGMTTNKATKWYGSIGHCPLCNGLCSERIPTPCGKCQRKDPKAASKWFAAHSASNYGGATAPKAADPLAIFNAVPCAHNVPGTCDFC
jgi:hypothetical protein